MDYRKQMDELERRVKDQMQQLYGENPPEEILQQAEAELGYFRQGNYGKLLLDLQTFVQNAHAAGSPVLNSGCLSASLAAWLLGLTETNPLPAHYRCPSCKRVDFAPNARCGADLPERKCPDCGAAMERDGYEIPNETFFGLHGEKLPSFAFRVAPEYRKASLTDLRRLFGEDRLTYAEKMDALTEEEHRARWETVRTHEDEWCDYCFIECGAMDKLSQLTAYQKRTGVDPNTIPFNDAAAMAACVGNLGNYFTAEVKGEMVTVDDRERARGVYALAQPKSFEELLHVEGLVHASVWEEYAKPLMESGEVDFLSLASSRDDVFRTLLAYGMDRVMAYKLMEWVRMGKGRIRGWKPEHREAFAACGVPDWYVDHISQASYLFPRAHLAESAKMIYRLSWYEAHQDTPSNK